MNEPYAPLPTRVLQRLARVAAGLALLALAWLMVTLALAPYGAGPAAATLPGSRLAPAEWRASAQDEEAFDEAFNKAQLNLRRRNYEDALKYFKRANGMKGNSCAECLWGMAQAYNKLGAQKNVLETCDRIVQAAADDRGLVAKAYNLKGVTFSAMATENMEKPDQKRLVEAEAAFRKTLEFNSELDMARYNLGVTLIRLNREAEGIGELKTYLKTADEDSDTAMEAEKVIENPRRARENYAPDFSITTTEGEYITSDDLHGKVVLVDFWGTWCPPCVESVPSLVSLNKKFSKDPFVLISVSSDSDAAAWRTFIAKNKMIWPQFLDSTDKVQRAFQVNSFPTYILIDHEGIVRYRTSGYNMYVEGFIQNAVKKALKSFAKAPPHKTQTAAAPVPSPPAPETKPSSAAPLAAAPMKAETSRPEGPAPLLDKQEAGEKKSVAIKLPTPALEILAAEQMEVGGHRMNRYSLRIKNWASLPDEMFEPVKDLPPCGMGASPTRLEVVIWSEDGRRLMGYCDMPRAEIYELFWLVLSPMQTPPERIYVTLKDRRSGYTIRSNIVSVPPVNEKTP